jgi:hypothetical protein
MFLMFVRIVSATKTVTEKNWLQRRLIVFHRLKCMQISFALYYRTKGSIETWEYSSSM